MGHSIARRGPVCDPNPGQFWPGRLARRVLHVHTACCSHSPRPTDPATDLGYLLAKHPGRGADVRACAFGDGPRLLSARRPTSAARRALLLDVDPVGLSRARRSRQRIAARAVRERSTVRRLVLPERGYRAGVRLGARRAAARSRPTLVDTADSTRRRPAVAAVPRRGAACCAGCSSRWDTRVQADPRAAGHRASRIGAAARTSPSPCEHTLPLVRACSPTCTC